MPRAAPILALALALAPQSGAAQSGAPRAAAAQPGAAEPDVTASAVPPVALRGPAEQTTYTLKLAEAVDTNPLRLSGAGSTARAALRAVGALEHLSAVGRTGAFDVDMRGLGQQVHGDSDEASLGVEASSALTGRVAPHARLGLGIELRGRFEPERACDDGCSESQAYRQARADARSQLSLGPIGWSLSAGARHFAYVPDAALSWYGPGWGTAISGEPAPQLRASIWYDGSMRTFLGEQTRVGINGGVYEVDGTHRHDTTHAVGGGLHWTPGRWVIGLRYAYQRNVSDSTAKSFGRHVIDPEVTGVPVGDLLVRVSGRVMRADYDTRGPLDASLRADEDDRNRLSVVLEHPIYRRVLFVETGWAFYAQAFQRRVDSGGAIAYTDERFRRHVAHAGLTVRLTRTDE